ncbi:alpha/beta fold hydrolase [Rhodococcus coprophilus]|uniref:Esterase n=1 Tax=Rhodococcus coprophilus TaxID=38310 RepID=A0A2X4TVL2_9NOCA|nr:alpha/beta fold hydrolase [Rhodococcus coprophilus]MBM7457738.1 pimeloyl-ACP methyl ester carboxylesterase [Rhodococcus coprophilus]SQI30359.1 esterase [Rhodococcus coprophilus]
MSHVVLVHGAWAGSWVWDTVTGPLLAAGHTPHALSLPGVGRWSDGDVTLDDVAGHVAEYVDGLEGTVVVVGHSGGGIVATQVAEMMPDRVGGVAYVAGMMLPSGVDFGQLCDGLGLEPPVGISKWLQATADGRGTVVPPEAAAAVFFHEADAVDAIEAARRLRPQLETARLMAPTWTADRFGSLPRLYIEAIRDRSVPLVAQREMQRLVPGATVVSLDADHAPQLSASAELAEALVEWCSTVRRAPAVGVGLR